MGNLFYTAAFVSAAVLLFTHPGLPLPTRLLSSAGKCTLTCYVTQTLVFTFLFFGWGLGLAQDMGPWPCLCAAVAVFLLQAWACRLWLSHFLYGPWNGSGAPPPCAACSLSANGCPKKIEILFTFFPFHPDFSERRRNRTHSLLRPARNKTIPALQEVRTMLKYPAATNRHRIPGT